MKKIMLIDDEPDVLEILKEFLEFLQFKVSIFEHPNEALQQFLSEHYDIIITDINLPEIDGFELIKKFRQIDTTIPIIVISGYIDEVKKEQILNIGANGYLEKPFNLKQLQSTIENIYSGEESCKTQIA